jgi:hypothetical protein
VPPSCASPDEKAPALQIKFGFEEFHLKINQPAGHKRQIENLRRALRIFKDNDFAKRLSTLA